MVGGGIYGHVLEALVAVRFSVQMDVYWKAACRAKKRELDEDDEFSIAEGCSDRGHLTLRSAVLCLTVLRRRVSGNMDCSDVNYACSRRLD